MKKTVSYLLTLCLTLALLIPAAAAESLLDANYTITEKLIKQMEAGSGFTATLTMEAAAVEGRASDAVTTIKPLVFDVSLIHVREDAATKKRAENRLTLALTDGENTQGTASLSMQGGQAYLQSSLFGEAWYALSGGVIAESALAAEDGTEAAGGSITQATQSLLESTAMPGLAGFALGLLTQFQNTSSVKLAEAIEPYATKIDLWIEGYRENAALGKLDDGTSTIKVDYNIPETAVKAQLKQLVLDLLNDQTLLTSVKPLLTDADVARYLDSAQQSYYFYAIDQLPLNGDLHISRMVSLKGDTLALSLDLPLYDSRGGAITLQYDRHKGEGDMPDENTIELQSSRWLIKADYQTYDTLTGTTVYQGTLLHMPIGVETFAVASDDDTAKEALKTFSAAFTVSHAHTAATDTDGKGTETTEIALSLTPDYTPDVKDDGFAQPDETQQAAYVTFTPIDMKLTAMLSSGQAKNAATNVEATLEITGEESPQRITLTLSGRTRGLWTPEAIDTASAIALDSLTSTELTTLMAQAGIRGGLLVLPYLSLPTALPAEESPQPQETVQP